MRTCLAGLWDPRAEEEVLASRHEGKEPPPLWHRDDAPADAEVGRQPTQFGAVEDHTAGARRQCVGDHAQRGGLARGVRAHERHELAGADLQGHAAQRQEVAVGA